LSFISTLDNLVIVLVRPRNPLNIGAAARAMSNFGAHRLRLVNPYAVAFREARSAVGASDLLKNAEEHEELRDAVADCALVVGTTAGRHRTLKHPMHTLNSSTAEAMRQHLQSGRVALLFGSEKIGLTNEDFSYCHWLLNIPTQQNHISMNLGQAVAVCLYELAGVPRRAPSTPATPRATGEVNEQISALLLDALQMSEYVKPGTDIVSEKKVRRLILRFGLDPEDAKVFLGMVRQIVWKLRGEKRLTPERLR